MVDIVHHHLSDAALPEDTVVQMQEGATWTHIDHDHTRGLAQQDPDLQEAGLGPFRLGLALGRLIQEEEVVVAVVGGGRVLLGLDVGDEALAIAATAVLVTEAALRVGLEGAGGEEEDENGPKAPRQRTSPTRQLIILTIISK